MAFNDPNWTCLYFLYHCGKLNNTVISINSCLIIYCFNLLPFFII